MATGWGNTPGTDRGEDILVTGLTAAGTYMSVGVLVDLDANTTSVIVGSNAVSATRSISGVTGAKFPMFAAFNGDICEANFGAGTFEHPVPAGYTVWDAAATWNASDKDASITLSGSNLIATGTAASAWRGVRATSSHVTSGKWYFEVKVRLNTGTGNFMIGVGNASAVLNNYFSVNANGASWQSNGNFGTNNSFTSASAAFDEFSNAWRTIRCDTPKTDSGHYKVEILCNTLDNSGFGLFVGLTNSSGPLRSWLGSDTTNNSAGFQNQRSFYIGGNNTNNVLPAALTVTHVIDLDIDLAAKTFRARIDGGTYSASQSIASLFPFGSVTTPIYVAVSFLDSGTAYDSVTANFGATAFTYSTPAGAHGWDYTYPAPDLRVTHQFIDVLRADAANYIRTDRAFVDVLNSGKPTSNLLHGREYVEVLRSGAAPSVRIGRAYVEVLRSATVNPIRYTKEFVEVLRGGPDQLRTGHEYVETLRGPVANLIQYGDIFVEVLRAPENFIQYGGFFVEVLRAPTFMQYDGVFVEVLGAFEASENLIQYGGVFVEVLRQPVGGASKFNRAVTIFT